MLVPSVFPPSSPAPVFQELLSLDDKAGAKSIVLRNRERVVSLSFPEGEIDIDTWEDWEGSRWLGSLKTTKTLN